MVLSRPVEDDLVAELRKLTDGRAGGAGLAGVRPGGRHHHRTVGRAGGCRVGAG